MQSGETIGSSGYNWAFTYTDTNNNGYIDHGDTIIVYTDSGGDWDTQPLSCITNGAMGIPTKALIFQDSHC